MHFSFFSTLGSSALFALLLLGSTSARAQAVRQGEATAQRFQPAIGPRNFFSVQGARTDGRRTWSLGLVGNYGYKPYVFQSCPAATNCAASGATQEVRVVESIVTVDAMGSFTVHPRVQLGLRLPISTVSGDGFNAASGTRRASGLDQGGLGDPAFETKVRIVGRPADPFVVGASAYVAAPFGHLTAKNASLGDSSFSGGIRAIVDGRRAEWSYGANVGLMFRENTRLGPTRQGSEFRYGAAAGYEIGPLVRFVAEATGAVGYSTKNTYAVLESLLGFQVRPLDAPLSVMAAFGPGLVTGLGSPTVRGMLGLQYIQEGDSDEDHDGVPNRDDKCPTEAEDRDGYQDDDGCPDPDNDGDGILDGADRCPNEPETVNGYQDADGCPDVIPDRDNDGIADADDKCPDAGGDVIRTKGRYLGCPDSDKDGVPDHVDKCPNQPEDTDGFQDDDGCPDPDNDKDGVLDEQDECVDVPGPKANRGCPLPEKAAPPPARKGTPPKKGKEGKE